MSDALEAAMAALRSGLRSEGDDWEDRAIAKSVVVAFVRAAVGCPNRYCAAAPKMCPAEHVQLSILGTVIDADESKCWWLCVEDTPNTPRVSNLPGGPLHCFFRGGKKHLPDCGWQPRMSALFGEAE